MRSSIGRKRPDVIDLTKSAIGIEESIAHAKAAKADAMKLAEENRIMLADLSIMAQEQQEEARHNPSVLGHTFPCLLVYFV
jgi:hypothetical protein